MISHKRVTRSQTFARRANEFIHEYNRLIDHIMRIQNPYLRMSTVRHLVRLCKRNRSLIHGNLRKQVQTYLQKLYGHPILDRSVVRYFELVILE